MNVVDSSVVIAAFATWHQFHPTSRSALAERPRLVSHVALETYSVLTRLPEPQRASGALVAEFLRLNFTTDPLTLTPRVLRSVPARLAELGISGGSTYDALIALTAEAHGHTIVSLDRRAASTYERCGASFTLLA